MESQRAQRASRHLQRAQELLGFGTEPRETCYFGGPKRSMKRKRDESWLKVDTKPSISISFTQGELYTFEHNILIVGMTMENLRNMVKKKAEQHFFVFQNSFREMENSTLEHLKLSLKKEGFNIKMLFDQLKLFVGNIIFDGPVCITCVDPLQSYEQLHLKYTVGEITHIISFLKSDLSKEHFTNKNTVIVRPSTIHFINNWYELKSTYTEKKPTFYFVGAKRDKNIVSFMNWIFFHDWKGTKPYREPNVVDGLWELTKLIGKEPGHVVVQLLFDENRNVTSRMLLGGRSGSTVTIYNEAFFTGTSDTSPPVMSSKEKNIIKVEFDDDELSEDELFDHGSEPADSYLRENLGFDWEKANAIEVVKNYMKNYSMFDESEVDTESLRVCFDDRMYDVLKVAPKSVMMSS